MQNNKVVLLLSGGIDSTVLLYWLLNKHYDVYPIHINYGQKPFNGEAKAINDILPDFIKQKLLVLNIQNIREIGAGTLIGEYPKMPDSLEEWYKSEFFPNRNMLFFSLAAMYSYKISCNKISIGLVGKNSYKDTSKEFLRLIKKTLDISLYPNQFDIIAPFAEEDRINVIKDSITLNVPIEKTFSCNSLGNRHCLLCNSCLEREQAFKLKQHLLGKI